MTVAVPDEVIDELTEVIDDVAGDSDRWSQAESVEIYEAIASHCRDWARTIREEMG